MAPFMYLSTWGKLYFPFYQTHQQVVVALPAYTWLPGVSSTPFYLTHQVALLAGSLHIPDYLG